VLQEYIKAKRLVDLLSARYNTEYNSKFLNWSVPATVQAEENSHGEAVERYETQQTNDEFESEYREKYPNTSPPHEVVKKSYPAGLPSNFPKKSIRSNRRTTHSGVHFDHERPTKPTRPTAPSPVNFSKIQSIYQTLKPAGVAGAEGWKEKRHFPTLDNYKVQDSQTFDLAQNLLERCRSRQV
jgi:hypothetical protein